MTRKHEASKLIPKSWTFTTSSSGHSRWLDVQRRLLGTQPSWHSIPERKTVVRKRAIQAHPQRGASRSGHLRKNQRRTPQETESRTVQSDPARKLDRRRERTPCGQNTVGACRNRHLTRKSPDSAQAYSARHVFALQSALMRQVWVLPTVPTETERTHLGEKMPKD